MPRLARIPRMTRRRLVATVLSLALACAIPACGSKEPAHVPGVEIAWPTGTTAPEGLRAEPVADLAPLRALEDGAGLLAAARFEPSGTALPAGTRVTWALATAR